MGELQVLLNKGKTWDEHGEELGRLNLEPKGCPEPLRHPQVEGAKV